MKTQLKQPKSQRQAENVVDIKQTRFTGRNSDSPASEIKNTDLADTFNVVVFPDWLEGRTGSKESSETDIPAIDSKITASKNSDIVTAESPVFDDDYYGRFFVWANGYHEEIIQVISTRQVRTAEKFNMASQGGCWTHGKPCGRGEHKKLNRLVLQFGRKLYLTDNEISSYSEITGITRLFPDESRSKILEYDDDSVLVINTNGIYKAVISVSFPYFYRVNSPIIETLITEVEQTEQNIYGRRYTCGAARIIDVDMRTGDRQTSGAIIEQESPTCLSNSDGQDWGDVFRDTQVGDGTETYGLLQGGPEGTGNNVATYKAITDGTFLLTITDPDGTARTYNFQVDLSEAESLEDVAAIMQAAVRLKFPQARVYTDFESGSVVFYISTGFVDGSTVAIAAGVGGTDITVVGLTRLAAGVAATPSYAEPSEIGVLTYPDENQFNFYSVYGSVDIGPNGIDPYSGEGNNPDRLAWVADVPVIKVFNLEINAGVITVHNGTFERSDQGSFITLRNGNIYRIGYNAGTGNYEVHNDAGVILDGVEALPAINETNQSAAIGISDESVSYTVSTKHGKVLQGYQNGHILTRVSGDSFGSTDVNRILYCADGTFRTIKRYIDTDRVEMLEYYEYDGNQAMALRPYSRHFCDTITDDLLSSRIGVYSLKMRFWEPLPSCNTGTLVPGFLVTGKSDEARYNYCQTAQEYKTLVGYHQPYFQYDDDIEDVVRVIRKYRDRVCIICSESTWGVTTQNAQSLTYEQTGDEVTVLSGASVIDNIGCNHIGSIFPIDLDRDLMVTHEPAVREFDGFSFGKDVSQLLVKKIIRRFNLNCVAFYSPVDGYWLYGAIEE